MFRALCILTLLLATTACTTRFIEDFEDDTIGDFPMPEPEGAPDDLIAITQGFGNVIVTGTEPIQGEKSLRFVGEQGTGATVRMISDTLEGPDRAIFVNWQGLITPGASILFELFTTGGDAIAVVRLQGGVVEVNGADIGAYAEGERHGIFITMNPANRVNDNFTFTMTSETEEVTVTDFRDPDFFPSAFLFLRINFSGSNALEGYVMDQVRMTEREPGGGLPG